MSRVLPVLAALSLAPAFAPVPPYRPKPALGKADLEKMQGVWACVSSFVDGDQRDVSKAPVTATIKGDLCTFGTPDDTWRLVLDAAGVNRRIDLHRVRPLGGIDLVRGIYRLEGDKMTVCWRMRKGEKERPVSFDPAQPNVWLFVYKLKRS
jgi:uncharacterized protein (TIGR03067 family)